MSVWTKITKKSEETYKFHPILTITTTTLALLTTLKAAKTIYDKYQHNIKLPFFNNDGSVNIPNTSKPLAILITGCSTGIGEYLAGFLANKNFYVIATSRRLSKVNEFKDEIQIKKKLKKAKNDLKLFQTELLKNNSKEIREQIIIKKIEIETLKLKEKLCLKINENKSTVYQLDITDNESIEKLKNIVENDIKNDKYQLWGIINNAGFGDGYKFEFETPMNICLDFVGLMYGKNVDLAKMNVEKSTQGGRICNMSSFAAAIPGPGLSVYSATKSAISAFTAALRLELSPRFGIWCSAHEFGGYYTNMNNSEIINKRNEKYNETEMNDKKYNYKIENNLWKKRMKKLNYENFQNKTYDTLADDVLHALTAKNPKRTYYSGVPSFYVWIANLVKKYDFIENKFFAKDVKDAYSGKTKFD